MQRTMAFKILCLALALVCAVSGASETRIVGGAAATIQEFPHTIALVYHFPSVSVIVQRCTGGLISSWHVLTSALCFSGADLNMFEVRGGSTFSLFGGTVTRISRVITHPSFRAEPLTADIAVVVLTSPMPLSGNINIMYLPPQNTNIPAGQPVRVASWGLMSLIGPPQQMLRKIYQSTVSLNQCTASYGTQNSVTIDDSVICATAEGAAGTCIGDSGAPMVIDRVVVGLAAHHQCGMGALPDVFTRVDRYTNWIMSVTRSSFTAADNAIPVRIKSVKY